MLYLRPKYKKKDTDSLKLSDPIFNFHDTLLLATAFQSFLFVLLISFAKRDHHLSDVFLIGFFLAQTAIPLHLLINFGDVVSDIILPVSPSLFRTFDIAFWLEGPLLLWYTRSLLLKEFQFKKFDLVFLAPAVCYGVYTLSTYHTLDHSEQVQFILDSREQLAPSLQHS